MLSPNFAYAFVLFFTALHAFVSAMTLGSFKKNNYFKTTMKKLRQASPHEVSIRQSSDSHSKVDLLQPWNSEFWKILPRSSEFWTQEIWEASVKQGSKLHRLQIQKASIYDFAVQLIVFGLFLGPAILTVAENYYMYDHDVTNPRNQVPPVTKNETGTFRYVLILDKKVAK